MLGICKFKDKQSKKEIPRINVTLKVINIVPATKRMLGNSNNIRLLLLYMLKYAVSKYMQIGDK